MHVITKCVIVMKINVLLSLEHEMSLEVASMTPQKKFEPNATKIHINVLFAKQWTKSDAMMRFLKLKSASNVIPT